MDSELTTSKTTDVDVPPPASAPHPDKPDTSWAKPGTRGFCAKDIIQLSEQGDIEEICRIATIMDIASLYDEDIDLYKKDMPSWQSRGHPRGLLGLGEYRHKGKVLAKKGALPELNRSCVMKAVDKYSICFGIPPVIAGVTSTTYTHDAYPTTYTHDVYPTTYTIPHRSDSQESCRIRG